MWPSLALIFPHTGAAGVQFCRPICKELNKSCQWSGLFWLRVFLPKLREEWIFDVCPGARWPLTHAFMCVHTCKQLPSNICACVVCRLALRCTRLCVSRGRTGKQGGFGAFGKANAMKSHFAFCLPCMTGDRASHKWGLTFHLAEGEEGSWHWGKATPWICGHTKRPGLGFWGHKECMGTRVGRWAGVHSRGELAELWGWGGFFS